MNSTKFDQFIITLGDYICMYIHFTNQEINFLTVYNHLFLNHLWSCVLKVVSELHDVI